MEIDGAETVSDDVTMTSHTQNMINNHFSAGSIWYEYVKYVY